MTETFDVLPPTSEPKKVDVQISKGPVWENLRRREVLERTDVSVDLSFRDSAGIRWSRTPIGQLEQVTIGRL